MKRVEKTVFISYRRSNFAWGFSIYQYLTHRGYDVFFDYNGIASGDFQSVILENINARAHFLVLLTPSALEGCGDSADLLRREIEAALDARRNMIPLMLEGFNFATPSIANQLTGKLAALKSYNALSMPPEYFEDAMAQLVSRYLNVSLDAVLHPASETAQRAALQQKHSANKSKTVLKEELAEQQSFERLFGTADLEDKQRFYSLIRSGNESSARGDLDAALKDYSAAILLNPSHAVAFYNRGSARHDQDDLDGAIDDYDQAIRLKPKAPHDIAEVFISRGVARRARGDVEGALEDYNEAIRLNPAHAVAFFNRGDVRQFKGDAKGALHDFNAAIRLNPNFANAFVRRGNVNRSNGDVKIAIEDYSEAIRLDAENAFAFNNRGSARRELGDVEGALHDFSEAIRLQPNLAAAFFNRGKLRRTKGEATGAQHDFNEAIRLGSNDDSGTRKNQQIHR